MKGWSARPLRTRIFVASSALVLAVLLATLAHTQWIVSKDAEATLRRELATTGQVFERLMAERAVRLATSSTLLASDFALKRVVATHFDPGQYDPDTLASAAQSYQQRLGVALTWITDENGTLLAESPRSLQADRPIDSIAPLQAAIETGAAAAGIAEVDGALFQLAAVPILAPDVIGYLVLGQPIDDAFAARLKADTGSDVSFVSGRRVFASSWPERSRAWFVPRREGLAPGTSLLTLGGERFLTLVVPVEAHVTQPLHALVQGSYDAALAPLRALRVRIAAVGVIALLVALFVGARLAGGITSPVRALVAGMREVIAGNLRYRSRIDRPDEIGFLARSFNEMVGGLEEREHVKDTFGRFVSRGVAEAVLAGRVPLEGERRAVTILFQDIRGFTRISAQLDPAALLRLLNRFFTEAVAAVEAEGGVVKQFTGDGVMALFGAPQAYTDHAERAVRAALAIVRRLEGLNERLRHEGLPVLQVGVGIHTGEVVAGLIGPDARVEYGVVGEAVNLASRVEGLTKHLQATVLVSSDIADKLPATFALGRRASLAVKGSAQPVHVVEVLGCATVDSVHA
jgi:adenylate cyclase